MIIYIGSLYILFGIIFLIIPIIYIELGRPKDLIKACLNLLIGFVLLIKNRIYENTYSTVIFLMTLLAIFYVLEIFSNRWNQLTDNEKNKLITIVELKKNLSKISEAISLGSRNFINSINFFKFNKNNEDPIKKKWVRNDKNDNIQI